MGQVGISYSVIPWPGQDQARLRTRPARRTPYTLRSRLLRHLHPVNLQSALTQARFVDWQRVADGEHVVEQRASAKSSGAFSTSTVSPVNIRPKANRRERRCVWRKGQGATYEYGSSLQIFFSRMANLPLAKAYGDRTDWACEVQFSRGLKICRGNYTQNARETELRLR